ncbi:MAG TPA: hypothetical protein VGS08_04555 [Candidatus Saccharimonadales bacterium]|nr:hypothetical protein [Candidatus Saccharimonadales bacterium]
MDQLTDILRSRVPQEPPEIAAIKGYIWDNFQSPATILIQNERIVIAVESAALANTLRFRLTQLQSIAQTSKQLVFRIG